MGQCWGWSDNKNKRAHTLYMIMQHYKPNTVREWTLRAQKEFIQFVQAGGSLDSVRQHLAETPHLTWDQLDSQELGNYAYAAFFAQQVEDRHYFQHWFRGHGLPME